MANENMPPKPKRATKDSHFHWCASTLNLWRVVARAIKSHKEQPQAVKGIKKQKKLPRAIKSKIGHQSWKNQNEQLKAKKSKWKPGLILPKSPS